MRRHVASPLEDHQLAAAAFIVFYLPMHTATRLAAPLMSRARRVNRRRLCAYGRYAPLNAQWLGERGITDILGPEAEADLVCLVNSQPPIFQLQRLLPIARSLPRLRFITPDRAGLPALERYARCGCPTAAGESWGRPMRRAAASTSAAIARSFRSITGSSVWCRSMSSWTTFARRLPPARRTSRLAIRTF